MICATVGVLRNHVYMPPPLSYNRVPPKANYIYYNDQLLILLIKITIIGGYKLSLIVYKGHAVYLSSDYYDAIWKIKRINKKLILFTT